RAHTEGAAQDRGREEEVGVEDVMAKDKNEIAKDKPEAPKAKGPDAAVAAKGKPADAAQAAEGGEGAKAAPRKKRERRVAPAITDVTPIPHNGCRPPKRRRV